MTFFSLCVVEWLKVMRRKLWFKWWWMSKAVKKFWNVQWERDINITFVVILSKHNATVLIIALF